MATRSLIGIETCPGTVKSIYCHYDGYPIGVGAELLDNYNEEELVRDLIELGSIRSLGETFEETRNKRISDVPPRKDFLSDYMPGDGKYGPSGTEFHYLYTFEGEWAVYDCLNSKTENLKARIRQDLYRLNPVFREANSEVIEEMEMMASEDVFSFSF